MSRQVLLFLLYNFWSVHLLLYTTMKRFIGLCFAITALAVGFCACEEVGGESDGGKHPQTTPSKLWMPAFLSDGMVVQQNSVMAFWGRTNPNATVTALAS